MERKEFIKRLASAPSGVECHFIQINNKIGWKVYNERIDRDRAFYNQRRASRHGLGPDTGKRFKMHDYYCYETEVVEVVGRYTIPEDYEIRELKSQLYEKIDWQFYDDHDDNLGYKNGKLIAIDFGE